MNLEELANELGLAALPHQEQQAMMAQMAEIVRQRVGLHFAEHMSDTELANYDTLSDKDPELANEALRALFPDYAEVVREQIRILKDDIQALLPPKA